MEITINSKSFSVETSATVAQALRQAELPLSGIAVAVNGKVVQAANIESKQLHDGDAITVIKAFYGG